MGAVKLELRCPGKVDGITVDPEPDWCFDALLSELNSLEKKLSASSAVPVPFIKSQSREISDIKRVPRDPVAFVMRVSDDEAESLESEDEEDSNESSVMIKRFNCNDLYISESDDSDYEVALDSQSSLMDEGGLVEGALLELSQEHQLEIKEEIRNQVSSFETELMSKFEKSISAFARIDKYKEARREMDKKLDTQYQRRIAEALENHLTAIQRDHELKSQIEERRIRNDAAYEEAKRKEKALQEEKLRQERARAEAEANLRAEEAKMAALEAERRAAKEAAEKEAAEASKKTPPVSQENVGSSQTNASSGSPNAKDMKKPQSASDVVRAAETARNLEQRRLKMLEEWNKKSVAEMSTSNKDFSTDERHIARLIRQIRGTRENVRAKSSELTNKIRNSSCPQSCIATFVKKVVSHCESPDNAAFASAYVIVLVASQIPRAMDLLLAEFHKACIYTVPKHLVYSKSVFESKEAYYKAIGYREDKGKIESTDDYLKRLETYMKLYGALVQTEIQGISNPHGPKEGWAWLARFLNALPANMYTAVALNAFLQAAGFVLFRKYKSQFRKILNIISNDFLKALKERDDSDLNPIIVEIQSYIGDNKFLQEPVGRSLQGSLLSSVMVPDSDSSGRDYYYGYNY